MPKITPDTNLDFTDDPYPPTRDLSRDNPLWLQLWRDNAQGDFHQLTVNALLPRFWPTLELPQGSRVLVPLCGKSLDMLWLAEQGHQVIGIELSPIAIDAFFNENHLKAKKQRLGNFIRWCAGNISIWCGDYFSLTAQQLGRINAVFDRAALTALPADIRGSYIEQLIRLTAADTTVLLLTVEDIAKDSRQASQSIDQELGKLCESNYTVRLLHTETIQVSSSYINSTNQQNSNTAYAKIYQLNICQDYYSAESIMSRS